MALHRLQLGLSEECLLSFFEKLGAPGPWSPNSQPPDSPGSTAREWSAPRRLPLRGRVTVPYCCLTGRLRSGGFHESSVGEGRGREKPTGLPHPRSIFFPTRVFPPNFLTGRF